MSRRKQFTDEELRERRNRQWYESRCRCGHVGICPLCGRVYAIGFGLPPELREEGGIDRQPQEWKKEQRS